MSITLTIIRFIVGILFVFSGLIKANDPLGLSYKMQEFFEVWNLHALHDLTLPLSIAIISFEIIAGVAVILGWKMKIFAWLLLLLIIFFTFLTGYALFSGKIKECGCFGNCIPLQASDSFIKDLILLIHIIPIFLFRNKIRPALSGVSNAVLLFMTTVFAFAFQWYVLLHLPVVDCLPYKKGNDILQQMKPPAGSVPDSTAITFVYDHKGTQVEFTADRFPEDFNDSDYKFVRRYDKLLRKGNAVPPIVDFALQTLSGNDTTQALLANGGEKLFLFLKDGFSKSDWPKEFDVVSLHARKSGMQVFMVTNLPVEQLRLIGIDLSQLEILRADATAIKTAARANPTILHVSGAIIRNKWSYADFQQALKYLQQSDAGS